MDAEPDPVAPADPEPLSEVGPIDRDEAVDAVDTVDAVARVDAMAPVEARQPGQPGEAGKRVDPVAGEELVELALASVQLSAEGLQPATGTVSLVDMEGGGRLDIVMARGDAALVQDAIADIEPPRPRTHDLLLAAVSALGGSVVGVSIVERRTGGIYVANVRLRRQDGSIVELDARPSDALNVALRSTGAVLRAARSLMDVPAN